MTRDKVSPRGLARTAAACAATMWLAAPSVLGAQEPQGLEIQVREAESPALAADLVWDARAVEHLFNRAGFGISPRGVERALRAGPEATVKRLLRGPRREDVVDPFFIEVYQRDPDIQRDGTEDEKRADRNRVNRLNNRQMEDYAAWWVDRMVTGDDPLRDRMTLFWHGLFTCSARTVRQSSAVLNMHHFVRDNAVDSYAELLRGMVRQPAILAYLDNDKNTKKKPNENFARELMELFSLGVGNYTEQDVKEAARCMTGSGRDRDGAFLFRRGQHDKGEKTVLGRTGRFDAEDLAEILLEQPSCAEYIAGRILAYLEGVEPAPERLSVYADQLRRNDYQLRPFLRRLFLDREFYRDEVVGTRIQGPVEHVVCTARRLRVRPPGSALVRAAGLLGQRLFEPPNVKGWEGGLAWITTSTLLQRGNVAGLMLGTLDYERMLEEDTAMMADIAAEKERPTSRPTSRPTEAVARAEDRAESDGAEAELMDADDAMAPMTEEPKAKAKKTPKPKLSRELRGMRSAAGSWRPRIHLSYRLRRSGAERDAEIVERLGDMLLGVTLGEDTSALLLRYLAQERAALELRNGEILEAGQDGELLLRRLAHQILSLPEAQLG